MPDDWSWFWAGESGRDNLLRDEIEGLQRTAYASSAQSARLSSQLRTLQGSIESRLQALSTAFDAYVELGDVREQLAGYPDTSGIRRDALRALTVLGSGGVPDRVDGREVDYWLVDAVNEVVTLASGAAPAAAPATTDPEHETFVVAALGWLGQGERVAARAVPLLVGDGALAAPQVVLWQAVVHGVYGDVLDAVRARWEPDLDLTAPTWDRFARDAARASGPVELLRWVQDLLRGAWSPAPATEPVTDDRVGLRRLVDALLGGGLGDERVLLDRARMLRARIEDPGGRVDAGPTEPTRTPVTDLVRGALLDPGVGPGTRQALVGWIRPGLQAAVAEVAAGVAARRPGPTLVHTEMGDLEVGTDGPDQQRLGQLDAVAAQRWESPRSRRLLPGVAAGVTLVAGLVLLPTDVGGLGVFLILVGVVLAIVLGRELLRARSRRVELAGVRERTGLRVEEGRAAAVSVRAAVLETKAEVATLARAVADSGASASADLR